MNWTEGNLARYSRGSKRPSKNNEIANKQREHFARARICPNRPEQNGVPSPSEFLDGLITHQPNSIKRKKHSRGKISQHVASPIAQENHVGSGYPRKRRTQRSHSSPDNSFRNTVEEATIPDDLAMLKRRRRNLLKQSNWIDMDFQQPLALKFSKPVKDSTKPLWTKGHHRNRNKPADIRNLAEQNYSQRRFDSEEGRFNEKELRIEIGSQIKPSTIAPSTYTQRPSETIPPNPKRRFSTISNILHGRGHRVGLEDESAGSDGSDKYTRRREGEGVIRRRRTRSRSSNSSYTTSIHHPMPNRPRKSRILRTPSCQPTSSICSINAEIGEKESTIPHDLREENDKWRRLLALDGSEPGMPMDIISDRRVISPGISDWKRSAGGTQPPIDRVDDVSSIASTNIPKVRQLGPKLDTQTLKLHGHRTDIAIPEPFIYSKSPSVVSNRTGPSLMSLSDTLDPRMFGLEDTLQEQANSSSERFPSSPPILRAPPRETNSSIAGNRQSLSPVRELAEEVVEEDEGTSSCQMQDEVRTPDMSRDGHRNVEARMTADESLPNRQVGVSRYMEELPKAKHSGTWMRDLDNLSGSKPLVAPMMNEYEPAGSVPIPFFTRPKSPPIDLEQAWKKFIFSSGSDDGMEDVISEAKHAVARSIVPSIPSVRTEKPTTTRQFWNATASASLAPSSGCLNTDQGDDNNGVGGPSYMLPNTPIRDDISTVSSVAGFETTATCGTKHKPISLTASTDTPLELCITHVTGGDSGSSAAAPVSPRVEIERQQSACAIADHSPDPLLMAGPGAYNEWKRHKDNATGTSSLLTQHPERVVSTPDLSGFKWAPPPRFAGGERHKDLHDDDEEPPELRPPGNTREKRRRNRYLKSGRTDIKSFPDFNDDPIEE